MDPATLAALVQLLGLVGSTISQYTQGTITDAQAAQMFQAACDNLKQAIANFEMAGTTTAASTTGATPPHPA